MALNKITLFLLLVKNNRNGKRISYSGHVWYCVQTKSYIFYIQILNSIFVHFFFYNNKQYIFFFFFFNSIPFIFVLKAWSH